jgi:3-hydroxyacyl-CoA dehydrogenase
MKQKINKIGIIGAGTMGTQISIQAASYGYEVNIFDEVSENFQKILQKLQGVMKATGRMPGALPFEEWEKGAKLVRRCRNLNEAVQEADLVIEALPENLELKRKIFAQIDSLSPL